MDKDEALKLALEALEAVGAEFVCRATHHHKKDQHGGLDDCPNQARHEKAITAIKQALAAPVQPVKPSLWEQYHAAQPAPVEPDWKAEYLKSVESGCITLDELREARAELDATNRQVEILSDALAKSRREVAAIKQAFAAQQEHEPENEPYVSLASVQPVQATMKLDSSGPGHGPAPNQKLSVRHVSLIDAGKTPPAAPVLEGRDWSLLEATQESLREHMAEIKRLKAAQPAVPDAIGPNEDELPAYAAGWNDCRAEILKGMK
jgi:hypothetical protein